MSREILGPPDAELRSLFEAEADFATEDAAMKVRVWRKVEGLIHGGPDGGDDGGGGGDDGGAGTAGADGGLPLPSGSGTAGPPVASGATAGVAAATTLGKTIAMVGTAFVLGGGAGVAVYHAVAIQPPSAVPQVATGPMVEQATAPSVAAPVVPDASGTESEVRTDAKPPTPVANQMASAPSANPATSAEARSQLAREREVIDAIRMAIARGHSDAALVAVGRHAKEFPTGRLSQEREGLHIIALVRAGRRGEAEGRAEQFRARFPNSLLLPAIDAALGK